MYSSVNDFGTFNWTELEQKLQLFPVVAKQYFGWS